MFKGFDEFVRGGVVLDPKKIAVMLDGTLSPASAEYVKGEVGRAACQAVAEMSSDMKVHVDTTQNVFVTRAAHVMVQALGCAYHISLPIGGAHV